MNAKDQGKLLDAGFKIIRSEQGRIASPEGKNLTGGKIKVKTKENRDWVTLYRDFQSNAALDKKMKELLTDPLIVED